MEERLPHELTTLMQKIKASYDRLCWLRIWHWKCHCRLRSSPVPAHVWQPTKHTQNTPNITLCMYKMFNYSQSFFIWPSLPELIHTGSCLQRENFGNDKSSFLSNECPSLHKQTLPENWNGLGARIPSWTITVVAIILFGIIKIWVKLAGFLMHCK